jgi:hypothetical protein
MLASFDAIQGASMGVYGRLSAFLPSALFSSGEEGAWYDPSDLSTLFQDSAGTTPVTTAGDPVGLMLDKRKGLVRGAQEVTNGDFATSIDDWIVNAGGTSDVVWNASGYAELIRTETSNANLYQTIATQVGISYELTIICGSAETGRINILLGTTAGSSNLAPSTNVLSGNAITIVFTATTTSTTIWTRNLDALTTSALESASVRSLAGNHATQATSAARPTYQYVWDGVGPLGDEEITNGDFATDLTGWTQTFNDADNYWEWSSGTARVISDGEFVPLSQAVLTAGLTYVLTLDVVITSGSIKIGSIQAGGFADVINNISASGSYTYTFTAASNTLYLGRLATPTDATIDNVSVRSIPVGSRLNYLAFDGVDDFLSVDGTSSQDWTIAAGLLNTAPTTNEALYGSFTSTSDRLILYPNDAAAGSGGLRMYLNTGNVISENGPNLDGVASVYAIRSLTTDHEARRNGVSIATSTSAEAANFFPGSIGAYNSSTQFGEFDLFSLVVREGAVANLGDLEQWIAGKSGVTL